MAETTQTTGRHGGRREGAGRPISNIDTIVRRLPEDLARKLVFELRIAAERLYHASAEEQVEMVQAMIAGIRQATTEVPLNRVNGSVPKTRPAGPL